MANSTRAWEQAKLFINDEEVAHGDPVRLVRGQVNKVSVETPAGFARQLVLGLGESGGLILQSSPDFQTPVDPVAGQFTWRVSSDGNTSGLVTLVVFSQDVALPWELKCWMMSADLKDEVQEVLLDDASIPPTGILLIRDELHTLTCRFKPGSPAATWPLDLTLKPLSGLQDADLSANPVGLNAWTLTVTKRSGTFQPSLMAKGFTDSLLLPLGLAMSKVLYDEANFTVDDVPASSPIFHRGQSRTVTLKPRPGSPITRFAATLDWKIVDNLDPADVTSQPAFGAPQADHRWAVTGTTNSGIFELTVVLEGTPIRDSFVCLLYSTNLSDEVELLWAGKPIPPSGLDIRGGDNSAITLNYLNGEVMKKNWLILDATLHSGLVPGDVSSNPPLDAMVVHEHQWAVTSPVKNGVYSLILGDIGKYATLQTPQIRVKK